MIDFTVDPEAGPTLFRLDPDHPASALWRDDIAKITIGSAWEELAEIIAPWDREVHALVTGSTRARRAPWHGMYGLASHYPATLVQTLARRFTDRPRTPVLDSLEEFIVTAADAGHDIAVCV